MGIDFGAKLQTVWLVHFQSLADHVQDPGFSKCSDSRLGIELTALRELLWQMPDGALRMKRVRNAMARSVGSTHDP